MPKDSLDKIRGMLGLCARARRISSGIESCEAAIRKGTARLVLIDTDASEQSKKSVRDACLFRSLDFRELPGGILAQSIGKPGRMAAAVTDDGFASSILVLMDQQRDCGGVCRE